MFNFQPSSKYVKKERAKEILAKAKPVVDWLENAEEESEEEDDGTVEVRKFACL